MSCAQPTCGVRVYVQVEAVMMAIAAVVTHYLRGLAAGAGILGMFMPIAGADPGSPLLLQAPLVCALCRAAHSGVAPSEGRRRLYALQAQSCCTCDCSACNQAHVCIARADASRT
jgi:hypothetical protein